MEAFGGTRPVASAARRVAARRPAAAGAAGRPAGRVAPLRIALPGPLLAVPRPPAPPPRARPRRRGEEDDPVEVARGSPPSWSAEGDGGRGPPPPGRRPPPRPPALSAALLPRRALKSPHRVALAGSCAPGTFSAEDPELDEAARRWAQARGVLPRRIQWYPGHMAAAEKALVELLRSVDVVLDVRDARCPQSSGNPRLAALSRNVPRVVALNRSDCVPRSSIDAWRRRLEAAPDAPTFARRPAPGGSDHVRRRSRRRDEAAAPLGPPPPPVAAVACDGRRGVGIERVVAAVREATARTFESRARRGMLPRPARLAVVGVPNVGKSALINRLAGRRAAASAPRPGVTRALSWVRLGDDLELLDSPGILPPALDDQEAAMRLAICDDLGEAAYDASAAAAALLGSLRDLGAAGRAAAAKIRERHGIDWTSQGRSPEDAVADLADRRFNAEVERAGQRLLREFRELKFGRLCLDRF